MQIYCTERINNIKVISSWSGGKDSCLACYKAILAGYDVRFILNFISQEHQRCCFHGISNDLMKAQSEAIGIPIVQKDVPADMDKYEVEFKSIVSKLRDEHGIQGMVFGDIYLDEHKDWVDRVCKDLNIIPIEPLWNVPVDKVLNEFIDFGFNAIVVSAKADIFDDKDMGKQVNKDFAQELKQRNICLCGENGEFHTFVYGGPMFKKNIEITETEKILKQGFWEHWFLNIKKYKIC